MIAISILDDSALIANTDMNVHENMKINLVLVMQCIYWNAYYGRTLKIVKKFIEFVLN